MRPANLDREIRAVYAASRGNLRLTGDHEWVCRQGRTRLSLRWQVIELWMLAAADLLATDDVGLVPWVPLTRFDAPADVVLRQCRQRIDRGARRGTGKPAGRLPGDDPDAV